MPNLHTVRPAAPGPCPLAAKNCGGCPLSGLAYPEQLALKQKNTEALLAKFGPVAPILGAEQPWGYRNKAVATFAQGPRGKLVCGTYAAGSHRVLPAVDCPLLAPRLNQTLAAALAAANAYGLTVQTAFREVADALAERLSWAERLAAASALVAANQKALELSTARFKAGSDNYLSVLDAQRTLYTAQQQLISLRLAEQLNRVALYKALGGDAPQGRP